MPQGTIRTYDAATRTGTLLDDGLAEHPFDAEAFRASGLQELRIGQRVRFQVEDEDGDARVAHLNIVSL
jgi:cold shock CspA family protein